jgi:excisionase family DNA binding protein
MAVSKQLTTKAAAQLLGVSEASVRRWSAMGLIPVQRLGPRQERRFRESDVLAFLESGRRMSAGTTDSKQTGAVLVAGLPVTLGTHLASVYETDLGRGAVSIRFLVDGILAGHHCLLFAAAEVIASYRLALAQECGSELEQASNQGRFTVAPSPGTSAAEALAYLEGRLRTISAGGPAVIRVVGDMASVVERFGSSDELISYEHMLGSLAKRFPAVFLCQYDARRFDGVTILRALKAHPDAFDFQMGRLLS